MLFLFFFLWAQAIERIKELAVVIAGKDAAEKRQLLRKCAETSLNSKLVGGEKEFFGEMVVDAVLSLEQDVPLKMIGIKKVPYAPSGRLLCAPQDGTVFPLRKVLYFLSGRYCISSQEGTVFPLRKVLYSLSGRYCISSREGTVCPWGCC